MRTIDTDYLNSDATNLSNSIDDLNTEVNKLNTTITNNQSGFQGDRGTDFFEIVTGDYITDLSNLVTDLENYQEFLSKVPKAYELLDEEFGNKQIDV